MTYKRKGRQEATPKRVYNSISIAEVTTQHKALLTNEAIAEAQEHLKQQMKNPSQFYTGHPDSVRIAFEFLDAQYKQQSGRTWRPLKHIIEQWAKFYVSTDAVKTAAFLHPDIKGNYPAFNLKAKLTRPSEKRLKWIVSAGTHPDYSERCRNIYSAQEVIE